MSDKRVGKSADATSKSSGGRNSDTRASGARRTRSQGSVRKNRAVEDRSRSDRTLTDDERLQEFRRSFHQEVLPNLPLIDGYHVCWVSTTNPRDTVDGRMRIGYDFVKPQDIPGWRGETLKSGQYEGCIGVNEMVAMKLPLELYQAYMAESHHHGPMNEEEKLTSMIDLVREQAAQSAKSGDRGVKIQAEEGSASIGEEREVPDFT